MVLEPYDPVALIYTSPLLLEFAFGCVDRGPLQWRLADGTMIVSGVVIAILSTELFAAAMLEEPVTRAARGAIRTVWLEL